MKRSFEGTALYRFFNVLLFLTYTFIILITIGAGVIGYSERKTKSATVICRDGTSWNAKDILYDKYALCGICTQRTTGGTDYLSCSYKNMDYSSYETKITREAWSWSILIYPLIVFIIGFGLVDTIKLIVLYIFSGKIALDKSVLLRLLVSLASDGDSNIQESPFEKSFPLLLDIVDKEDVLEAGKLQIQAEEGLEQAEVDLNSFFRRTGYDKTYFKNNKSLDLDVDVLEEYYRIDNNYKYLQLANFRLNEYFQSLEKVNEYLVKGESIEKAKRRFQKLQDNTAKEVGKFQAQLELSKAIGEELLALKRKYGKKYKDKTVNIDDVIERVYKKHPDWKKTTPN